jgi:two-component system OmpR family response regulator
MGANSDKLAVIIEDDADVRHLLKTVLTQSGFDIVMTSNGEDGIDAVRTYNPTLTTLDVSMPGMDGFAVAKRIREFSSTYIVMLTALADEIDIVQGLESGADDYLLKPFRPRELRARIETMMRRPRERLGVAGSDRAPAMAVAAEPAREPDILHRAAPAPSQPVPVPVPIHVQPPVHVQQPVHVQPVVAQSAAPVYQPEAAQPVTAHQGVAARPTRMATHEPAPVVAPVQDRTTALQADEEGWLSHHGLNLNLQTRTVQVDGRNVDLTRSEFDLLAALMGSGRRVRSKADLVLALRGETYVTTYYVNDADKRAVEVHVANLRRKIGDSSATPRFIETVRGVGYRLATGRDDA